MKFQAIMQEESGSPDIPGLGSIALASFMLLTAVGAVFFAFPRRREQNCDIERKATISEHFLGGRDSAGSYVHLYAGNSKVVVHPDGGWPYYVPIYYYDVEPLFPWY